MRNFTDAITLVSAKATTGTDLVMDVRDYRHIVAQIATASSGNLTIKAAGSISDIAPTFNNAQSATNSYEYINLVDYATNSVIAGATGIAFTGTDGVRLVELNTNGLKWIAFNVTAISAGNVTVKVMGFNDN